MKKFTFLIFVLSFAYGLECKAQFSGDKAIIFGTISYDGHQKAKKGAFWATRPEAKIIYEGGSPPGYNVYVLDRPSFVRYIEHNNDDGNYIVFETGSRVYTDSTGQFYDSYCGNKIGYIGPVERFIVQEKVVVKETADSKSSQSETGNHNVLDYGKVPIPPKPPIPAKIEIPKEHKPFFKRRGVKIGGGILAVVGAEELIRNLLVPVLFPKGSPVTNPGHDAGTDDGSRVTNTGHQ